MRAVYRASSVRCLRDEPCIRCRRWSARPSSTAMNRRVKLPMSEGGAKAPSATPGRYGGQPLYFGGDLRRERPAEPPFSPDGSSRGSPAGPATGLASQIASFTCTTCSLSAANSL